MSTYRFNITQTIYGYIDAEIGDVDPEQYAEEMLDKGLGVNDFTYIRDAEAEVDDWDKL